MTSLTGLGTPQRHSGKSQQVVGTKTTGATEAAQAVVGRTSQDIHRLWHHPNSKGPSGQVAMCAADLIRVPIAPIELTGGWVGLA